jgi:hypothetical protein
VTPGNNIQTQILQGEQFGRPILGKEYMPGNVELIGLEQDLLDVSCPYTYIASGPVFAYEIPYQQFYKSMQDLNPRGIAELRRQCAVKFNWFA